MKTFEQAEALKRLPNQFFAGLSKKVAGLVEKGHDIINLGQGNPDLPTPPHIVETLQKEAVNPKHHRYSPFQGYDSFKEAVAEYYKREFDVDVDPKTEVAILFGAKTGLVEISQCLLNPGDTALVPDPGYPDYWSGLAMVDANLATMPLKKENDFLPDYNVIPQSVLQNSKLMFLNYPNNPTGANASASFFEETVNVADRNNVCVVHDLAYGAIVYDQHEPISFLQTPGAKDVGIEISSMSKTYNMAGWRVGFAVGNPSVIDSLELIQDHYYVSLFGGIQEASAQALLGSQQCVADLVGTYEKRRNVLISRFREIGWDVEAPEGSFFSWLPVPEGYTSEEFSDLLLEKADVVMAPGIGFGEYGEGYVRVALLESEQRIAEAADRIDRLKLF